MPSMEFVFTGYPKVYNIEMDPHEAARWKQWRIYRHSSHWQRAATATRQRRKRTCAVSGDVISQDNEFNCLQDVGAFRVL